jgi:SpoVK/Ycf46/Vps4 family AAA+-type ATPase
VRPPLDSGFLHFEAPPLSEEKRAAVWRDALERASLPSLAADELAAKYRVGPGTVERVVRAAALHDDGEDSTAALETALRRHRDSQIGTVATRVSRLASWSNIVLPPEALDSIREFISRVRHRRTVYESWGFDRVLTTSRGLTALFSGGPGTGKSMVAGVVARELGYDLYRVDLSRVLSKWVGETEKNLATVFDAAEDGEVMLLFDEADALFARRTSDVRTSADRYANAEVNYLLQRLDTFEGIAILTTNADRAIDQAFKRRLSFRLSFPFPDDEMRAQLWRVHLPNETPTEGELDFDALARKYQLSGGYIRNSVVRAAFLAAQQGSPLKQEHLERAVVLEYREVGKLVEGGLLE